MKCSECNKDADFHRIVDDKDIYLCWSCAEKKHNVSFLWSRHCYQCGCELDPKGMYTMQKPYDQEETLSFCSLDCAMELLGYDVLPEDEDYNEEGE